MRPWAGHYNHFHVRLGYPQNSELCINQADVNNSSGCGSELDFWMKKDKLFESNSTKIRKWMLLSDLPKSVKNIYGIIDYGEVAEWFKAHAWNACIVAILSRVRSSLSAF